MKKFVISEKGYTLVELLSAIALFAFIGTIAVSIVTFTLRGSKKSDVLETVRQNGDAALSQMVRTMRYAKSLDSPMCIPAATSPEITVTSLADHQTTFSCTQLPNTITANDIPYMDTNSLLVQNCSFSCRQPTYADTPTITIQFTLVSKDTSGFFENKVSIPFQTTVTMRNLNR